MTTRRGMLQMMAAGAASAAVPLPAIAAEPSAYANGVGLVRPLLPAWAVGDWENEEGGLYSFRAETEEDALRQYVQRFRPERLLPSAPCRLTLPLPDGQSEWWRWSCRCESCDPLRISAERVPEWDAIDKIEHIDWLRATGQEFSISCDRCDERTATCIGGREVGGKVVCEECFTLDDLRLTDPKEYAERMAEEAEDNA